MEKFIITATEAAEIALNSIECDIKLRAGHGSSRLILEVIIPNACRIELERKGFRVKQGYYYIAWYGQRQFKQTVISW